MREKPAARNRVDYFFSPPIIRYCYLQPALNNSPRILIDYCNGRSLYLLFFDSFGFVREKLKGRFIFTCIGNTTRAITISRGKRRNCLRSCANICVAGPNDVNVSSCVIAWSLIASDNNEVFRRNRQAYSGVDFCFAAESGKDVIARRTADPACSIFAGART